MRDQRLDLQRRAVETSDDDLIPFGDRPTVSRFGAISRTSKTLYQGAGPMQAMAPQGAPTKPISISGKNPRLEVMTLGVILSVLLGLVKTMVFKLFLVRKQSHLGNFWEYKLKLTAYILRLPEGLEYI